MDLHHVDLTIVVHKLGFIVSLIYQALLWTDIK